MFVGTLAWRTQLRLENHQTGGMCIVAQDAALAHRPGKENSVRAMLARAVLVGDDAHDGGPAFVLRFAATDYLGLAFTTHAQRARWYDALPRCRSR